MAKKNEIEKEEKRVEEQPTLAKEFEYENIGNIPYDLQKNLSVIDLRAQVPFRMVSGDVKVLSVGLKVRIPEGHIGLVCTDIDLNNKNQVCVFGAPIMIRPELDAKEIMVPLKMFGTGYKVVNMGDKIAALMILPMKDVKSAKK